MYRSIHDNYQYFAASPLSQVANPWRPIDMFHPDCGEPVRRLDLLPLPCEILWQRHPPVDGAATLSINRQIWEQRRPCRDEQRRDVLDSGDHGAIADRTDRSTALRRLSFASSAARTRSPRPGTRTAASIRPLDSQRAVTTAIRMDPGCAELAGMFHMANDYVRLEPGGRDLVDYRHVDFPSPSTEPRATVHPGTTTTARLDSDRARPSIRQRRTHAAVQRIRSTTTTVEGRPRLSRTRARSFSMQQRHESVRCHGNPLDELRRPRPRSSTSRSTSTSGARARWSPRCTRPARRAEPRAS